MIKYIYKIKCKEKSANYKKKDKIKYGSSPMYNLIPRVLSYPSYGARDPGKCWSRVSQNLGDQKQLIWGRGR